MEQIMYKCRFLGSFANDINMTFQSSAPPHHVTHFEAQIVASLHLHISSRYITAKWNVQYVPHTLPVGIQSVQRTPSLALHRERLAQYPPSKGPRRGLV